MTIAKATGYDRDDRVMTKQDGRQVEGKLGVILSSPAPLTKVNCINHTINGAWEERRRRRSKFGEGHPGV